MKDLSLPQLAAKLRGQLGPHAPRYQQLYLAALNGEIPARQERGRWYVAETAIPSIADQYSPPRAA
jgi:hypothetical protein